MWRKCEVIPTFYEPSFLLTRTAYYEVHNSSGVERNGGLGCAQRCKMIFIYCNNHNYHVRNNVRLTVDRFSLFYFFFKCKCLLIFLLLVRVPTGNIRIDGTGTKYLKKTKEKSHSYRPLYFFGLRQLVVSIQ